MSGDGKPATEQERLAYRSKSWMRSLFRDGAVSFGMFRSVRAAYKLGNLDKLGKWEKEFISWDTCPLHTKPVQQIIKKLRDVFMKEPLRGLEQSLVGVWIGNPHVVLVTRNLDCYEDLLRFNWDGILVPPFDRVWFHCNAQVGKKVFGHHEILKLAGPPMETIQPIRAFRQVAQSLLVEARSQAVVALLEENPELILDLYCGTGELSLLLPEQVGWLGIECSAEAVEYANTLRQSGESMHVAFTGAGEQRLRDPNVLSRIAGKYSIYLNPPRSGLSQEAREMVISLWVRFTRALSNFFIDPLEFLC